MEVKIRRVSRTKDGTFGVLLINERPICVTLEDPDNGNKPRESCIPPGTYDVVPHNGERYKNVWRLERVPGRSAILIHQGNTISDTEGCILVGTYFGDGPRPSIMQSVDALNKLRKLLPGNFTLIIE